MLIIFILLKLRDTGCQWYSSLNLIKLLKYLKYLVSRMFKRRQMRGLCLFVPDLTLLFDVLCNTKLLSYREKKNVSVRCLAVQKRCKWF